LVVWRMGCELMDVWKLDFEWLMGVLWTLDFVWVVRVW
jgi:hypothetical protein